MRAIVGVQIVESGEVRVLGEPTGSPAVRARVGYVMQAPAVYPAHLSARENLRYFAGVLRVGADRVEEALEIVQLRDHADRPVGGLSGGQRARVSLGTALLGTFYSRTHQGILSCERLTEGSPAWRANPDVGR